VSKHNHITRDIKPLGECPSCDEYHDKHIPKRYLEYPAVIDWLQWGDFPEVLGGIDYPQVTLTMIAEMRADLKNYQLEIHELKTKYDFQQLVKENDRLRAENEKLKSEFNEIWTPAFGELKAEITKLREQVKDYEGALKTIENKDTDGNNERALCDSVNLAREVLKKWSGV